MTSASSVRQGRYVVMGVSGCGKSTIGRALAERLGLAFIDGDDLHPTANVAKMSRGEPLDDSDRGPWLERVGALLTPGTIIACSALKRVYRDRIRHAAKGPVTFIYLRGARETLAVRVGGRAGHFMPAELLESQIATLEEPTADESTVTVDIENPPATILTNLVTEVARAI